MPFHLNWCSEHQTSILLKLIEPISWDEFHQSVQQAHTWARTVEHSVSLIIVVTARFPNGNPLVHFTSASQRQPTNLASVILVPLANQASFFLAFAQHLNAIISKVHTQKNHILFAKTLKQALALAEEAVQATPDDSIQLPAP